MMAVSTTSAVASLRRARRIKYVRTGEDKRRANRLHRRSRHQHEIALRLDAYADHVPPRKLTEWDVH